MNHKYGLIADIGGTNARFALVPVLDNSDSLSESQISHIQTLSATEYPHIEDAIRHYLENLPEDIKRPQHGVMAIACPTDKDEITMTNNKWSFSVSAVRDSLGLKSLEFINDFYAVANAVPYLSKEAVVQIGSGEAKKGMPCVVTGPGTGLGLGAVVYDAHGHAITVQGEGGHSHFAPVDDTEVFILNYLQEKYPRVSVERLISGHGLENIYEALFYKKHDQKKVMKAADISKLAQDGSDDICRQSLDYFCAIFGSFTGDAALMYGAKGGVFIGGGIMPRMIDYLKNSQYRKRFTEKARLSGYVTEIPTFVIISDQPGLLGAAAILNNRLNDYF